MRNLKNLPNNYPIFVTTLFFFYEYNDFYGLKMGSQVNSRKQMLKNLKHIQFPEAQAVL